MSAPGERVAVVTGAAAGIGRASALRLASDCGTVVVVDRADEVKAVVAAIEAMGSTSVSYLIDVAQPDEVERVTRETLERFGSVDVLVNCAGVLGPEDAVETIDEAVVRQVLEINFFSMFYWLRAVLPSMKEAGWGRIVSITSGARHGQELRTAYSSSKAAMSALMRTAALESASTGVLVNCIEPGRTLTDMVTSRFSAEYLAAPPDSPIGRYAEPAEIAEAVAFLCSESCTFATGATFNISGGMI